MDGPIFGWACSVESHVKSSAYMNLYNTILRAYPGSQIAQELQQMPKDSKTLKVMVAHVLPLAMMHRAQVPRNKWVLRQNASEQKWIEEFAEAGQTTGQPRSIHTFVTSYDHGIIAMVACTGRERAKLGLGLKQLTTDGEPLRDWLLNNRDKLTAREVYTVTRLNEEEEILRRAVTLLTIKESLIRAIGLPITPTNYLRIECHPVRNILAIDGELASGWEFQIFHCEKGYHYCFAVYRGRDALGNDANRFEFLERPEETVGYTTFDLLSQLLPSLPYEGEVTWTPQGTHVRGRRTGTWR